MPDTGGAGLDSILRKGYAKFDVENPPLNLVLNEVPGVEDPTMSHQSKLSHLGIQVASTAEVLSVREGWRNAGLTTRDEMQTNCGYAIQDKT